MNPGSTLTRENATLSAASLLKRLQKQAGNIPTSKPNDLYERFVWWSNQARLIQLQPNRVVDAQIKLEHIQGLLDIISKHSLAARTVFLAQAESVVAGSYNPLNFTSFAMQDMIEKLEDLAFELGGVDVPAEQIEYTISKIYTLVDELRAKLARIAPLPAPIQHLEEEGAIEVID
jgi:hypothetical protein